MTDNDTEIVGQLCTALSERVGPERFALWFGTTTQLEFDGQTLTVRVPNRFFFDWIRTSFRRHLEGACFEVLGECPPLRFCIEAKLPEAPPQRSARPGNGQPRDTQADHNDSEPPVARPRFRGPRWHSDATLESFVVGPSNRLSLASAEMAVRNPGQLTPLVICGPTSVGKTHLLEGIRTAARALHGETTVVYLSAEQFTTYFLEALRGSGLPSFRRKYRGVGLLLLDDLQFFAGKQATQVELLHTVDTLLRDGRQLVLSADRPPAELGNLGMLTPELATRLESGMVCRIEPPEYPTRLGIVAQLARRMKLAVPAEVQAYIAARLTSHARELSGALCRLKATAEALGKPITLPLAEDALAEMIRHSGRPLRLKDIEAAVCNVFGLEPHSLRSGSKRRAASHPRMLAMWLARKHTRTALSEIGHYFGRRSHSTVISAQKQVDRWMAKGQMLHLAEGSWAVDEAIRRVELQLRAAG